MAKALDFIAGDRVSWNAPNGPLTGEILRKAICRLLLADREFEASRADPRFIVRDDLSGELFAPRAETLRRLKPQH
jgi:hypothetical protein